MTVSTYYELCLENISCICKIFNSRKKPMRWSLLALLFKENFVFWPCLVACRILVSQLGFESMRPAVEPGVNHWTAREFTTCSTPQLGKEAEQ